MVIDAHHHFWKYDPQEYGWISDAMAVLRRDYLPPDLLAETRAGGVDGVVSVQARQTSEETRWLLDLADANDFIRGVVGWVPLVSDRVREDLERLAANPKLKAVRHVLQDEPDERYVLGDAFNRGVGLLKGFGLRYDLLIYARHLPHATAFVDRHPDQSFVLDHMAKPPIRDGLLSPWREQMRELGRRANVCCKLSGLATEADHAAWTPAQLEPYLNVALAAFGPRRLMFGSDWPVCLLASDYGRWARTVSDFAQKLSPDERARVMGGTAVEVYGL